MSHKHLAQQTCKSDEDEVHLASTPHCVCIHEWPSPPTHTGSPEQGDEQSVSVYMFTVSLYLSLMQQKEPSVAIVLVGG